MRYTKICLRCSKKFQIKKGSNHTGQYCSRKCYWGQKIQVRCLVCNKIFQVQPCRKNTVKYCSTKCMSNSRIGKPSWNKGMKGVCFNTGRTHFKKGIIPPTHWRKGHKPWNKGIKWERMSGEKHPNWKGGIKPNHSYTYIYYPKHPNNYEGYVLRHRLVAEQYLKRFLTKREIVHHINLDKTNDRPENLYVFKNQSYHQKFHWLLTKDPNLILKSNIV